MTVTTSMVLLTGMVLACGAQAGETAQADANVYFNGVNVAIDPVTGRLRAPTADEAQALRVAVQQMASATSKGMPQTRADAQRTIRKMRDGSVMAQVSQDMLLSVEAVRQADGTVKVIHAGDTVAQEAGHE